MKITKLLTIVTCFTTALAMLNSCRQAVKFPPPAEDHAVFKTSDGVLLVGKFEPPAARDNLTFIMLHGLASTRGEWMGFAQELNKEGYGYFIFDMRGHGESVKDTSGRGISFKYFRQPGPGSEWNKMPDDIAAAIKYLKKKKGIPKEKIGIIGASLGANAALIYASQNKTIPLAVLLSPGWEYAGLTTAEASKNYGSRPLFIASSPLDKYAYKSSGVIFDMAKRGGAKTTFAPGENAQHGVQMFDGASGKKFVRKLIDWIISAR